MHHCTTNLPWGYQEIPRSSNNQVSSPEAQQQLQYANLPAALLSTLKREKKPFTYTPGGVNLSEVLEARLQKRMERKKKYMEEMEQEQDSHKRNQVLMVSPTYNSPLNMYSVENALETLEVQAQMAANSSHSPSSTLPRNYKFKFQENDDFKPSQSKSFRVLQVMTDTEVENRKQKEGPVGSEMRWTGIREVKTTNPSRFFHALQKITGTDTEEESERQENTRFEKPITQTQATQMYNPPATASHVTPVHHQTPQTHAPALQPSPSFGYVSKLKRPAAFLPKQQLWSYTRSPAVTPVGTDF